ncbi:MAG: Asp-tRNA(Asn)/Glu-tRNA(Gln) amidotransferase subunit GatC [Candidatus Eremiobacteraeota bacterium]|nr:Asp-tRNA(Asn)/Glu-tRNA(Gln) amidotransferase subunit GatC [Candidatus Eremiobacteraeota bacterium]
MAKSQNKSITVDEVRHMAHLCRLQLSPEDIDRFTGELGEIIDYVNQIQKLETSGIDPTFQTAPLSNIFRKDVIKKSLSPEEVLSNAPDRENDYFKMPPIMGKKNG